jgi:hypothetical protein
MKNKTMKKNLLLKVYRFRIDAQDNKGYFENMENFDILAETFEEAVEEVKKRIAKEKNYVIGEVSLISVID